MGHRYMKRGETAHCEGKVKRSKENAESYIRRSGHPFLIAYKCDYCKSWHVGHAKGSR